MRPPTVYSVWKKLELASVPSRIQLLRRLSFIRPLEKSLAQKLATTGEDSVKDAIARPVGIGLGILYVNAEGRTLVVDTWKECRPGTSMSLAFIRGSGSSSRQSRVSGPITFDNDHMSFRDRTR